MMKSFFKKLAFVMALAMVVTLAAPAAQASAADALGIVLQNDNTWTVKETGEVAVGATVDYRYKGAPANYKELDPTWASSNEKVATVDKNGLVTGVADGVATISITLSNGQTGSIEVTVGYGDVNPDAFEAKQKSHITFDVNFNKEVNYGRDNVNLYRVFETDKGDVYVVWAVRKATLSADKKTLTVEPYVQFNDGERYLVAFEDIETKLNNGSSLDGVEYDEFTVKIGAVDTVKLDWYSTVDGVKSDKVAYTNGEDAEEDIEVTLTTKLFCGDVDLTEIYKNDGYVEYTLINEEAVAEWVVLSDNTLIFTKENIPATVQATYVFENAEGEEQTAKSAAETIVSKLLPPFAIEYVKEWSFVEGDWKWDKPDHSIRAGKEAQIALLLVDNRGGQWETVAKDSKIADFGAIDTDTEDMYLRYYSTDNDHFLIDDETGVVETYIKMKKAVVYVALHDEALLEEYDYDFVRNIGACVMEIQDPAQFSSVGLYKGDNTASSVTLVTDAVEDPANTDRFVEELTTASYTIKTLDQDKAVYNPDADPVLTNTEIKYTLSTTNKDIRELMGDDDQGITGLEIVGGSLDVDAVALNAVTNSSTITATITATQYDENGKELNVEKTSFKVYLRDPELYDEDDAEANNIPGVWTVGDVKPTSWGLAVDNVGLMTKTGVSTAKVKLSMLSKSYVVGYYNRYDMSVADEAGTDVTIIEDAKAYEFGKAENKIHTEGIYVLVVGPDGKAVKAATSSAASGSGLGVYVDEDYFVGVNVTADDDNDGYVDYLATGKYTVKVTFVTDVKVENGVVTDVTYKTRTANFTVTDDLDPVNFVDMYEVETDLTVDGEDDLDAIKDVIQKNYKFTYDITNKSKLETWVPTDDEILAVNCIIKGDYITIKSITFRIATGDDYYVTVTRDINRAVKLGVTE